MMHEVRLSTEAERCIQDQILWYEADESHGGPDLADRWLKRLETALDTLTKNPERHGFAPENGRWLPEIQIRQLSFQPWKTSSEWRILYVIHPSLPQLTVLQIRHSKRPPLF